MIPHTARIEDIFPTGVVTGAVMSEAGLYEEFSRVTHELLAAQRALRRELMARNGELVAEFGRWAPTPSASATSAPGAGATFSFTLGRP